jgi:hypothetical protein
MKSICVFCGSNSGARPQYRSAASALGAMVAKRDLKLIYGGASVGLMGAVADAALAAGGHVVGVMPEALVAKEISHKGLSDLHVVASMHERKALMADLADGFVALPGGIGTLEELFEVWTWGQLGDHQKPIGLLNIEGYFQRLLSFLDHQADEQFMAVAHRNMLIVEADCASLLDRFATYRAPTVAKWLDDTQR